MKNTPATIPSPVAACCSLFGEQPADILNAFDTAAKTFSSMGILIDGIRDELSRLGTGSDEIDSLLSSAGLLAMRHGEFLNQFSTSMQETMEGGAV